MSLILGLDADDTLWENESYFRRAEDKFNHIMAPYAAQEQVETALLAAQWRNIEIYGFGVKGFILDMIEVAHNLSEGKISSQSIAQIIAAGREILDHPVELLPDVAEVLADLSKTYQLVLITKGDLSHQERKIEDSGLSEYFSGIEIVSHKIPQVYDQIFHKYGDGPAQGLMLGNSLKSDVAAPIAAGAHGVFIPHGPHWALESAPEPIGHLRYHRLNKITEFPALLHSLTAV